ncbi:MAG: hypothetical protein ACTSW1_00635 [Candidatus Hodarchaeales archaeon]
MKVLFTTVEKGVFPCPFCWIDEMAKEVINNSKPLYETIKTKWVEKRDPITFKYYAGREVHTPLIDLDGLEILGASDKLHIIGIIHGIESARRGESV